MSGIFLWESETWIRPVRLMILLVVVLLVVMAIQRSRSKDK